MSPRLARPLADLVGDLANVDPDAFAAAVDRELRGRMDRFLTGLDNYRHHPYRRRLEDPPEIWREGTTRLLDYGGPADGQPLLVVPSLVNRSYVLDLNENRSFMRAMAVAGYRPLLIDWEAPGDEERRFGLTEYIAGRLERVLDVAIARTGRPPAVLGYCMGGLLALGLAVRRPEQVAALVLLAAPWDFHAERGDQTAYLDAVRPFFEAVIGLTGELPLDLLQSLFFTLDPGLVERKFRSFAGVDRDSPKAAEFVALEDWLNDGMPLAGPVAHAVLFDWYGANLPARGQWQVGGVAVVPSAAPMPTLVVVPHQDRIVPPASALAVADSLPRGTTLRVPAGHIGMMTGGRAPAMLYRPVAEWLAGAVAAEGSLP